MHFELICTETGRLDLENLSFFRCATVELFL